MKSIRNIAVSGVDSQEKYDMVCDLVGDDRNTFPIASVGDIMYDDEDIEYFMGFWGKQDYSHCTLYTYEEFIAKYGEEKPDDFTVTEVEASNQYFVFVKGGPTPTVKHDTFEEAIKERDRLSKLPSVLNREIYICEIVEAHRVITSLVKIEKEK